MKYSYVIEDCPLCGKEMRPFCACDIEHAWQEYRRALREREAKQEVSDVARR